MKYKEFSLYLLAISIVINSFSTNVLAAEGKILEKRTYTAVVAAKREENKGKVLDYSEKDKQINSLVVAAYEGKNEVTVKGNGTVSDTIANQTDVAASKWKNFDGTEVKAPEPWTIVKEKPIGYLNANRYKLESSAENAGLLLADKSYKGHNDITLENVSIKTISSRHSIFGNQTLLSDGKGMSDTTITFKGTNYLFTDGSKVTNKPEMNGIELLKSDNTLMNTPTKSHTYIKLEKDSTLNIYTVSGTAKGRGIGITQYRSVNIKNTGSRTTIINQTEMDFYGAVNIKVDRGNMMNAENYGVYVGNLPKKYGTSDDVPEESYDRATFYSDVKIDVQPVLDENGKQKSIGDALNIDGKNSKVEIKGDGKVQIDGDIHVLNGGKLELNLKNKDSYFHGEAHIGKLQYGGDPDDPNDKPNGQRLFEENRDGSDPDKANTKFNFTMTNGARWMVTNTSKINDLNISAGAEITFSKSERNVKVSVENLKENGGVFKMQGSIEKKADGTWKWDSDRLEIRKSSEGKHIIEYEDNSEAHANKDQFVKLVENKSDKDKNKAEYKLKNPSEMGAYLFDIGTSDASKLAQIDPDGKQDFYLHAIALTPAAQTALIISDSIYQLNLVSMETLVQRMGEIHFDKEIKKKDNVWVKEVVGEYRQVDDYYNYARHSNTYQGIKIGYDKVRQRKNWINYNGLSLGYMMSETKIGKSMVDKPNGMKGSNFESSASVSNLELGAYSTWLNKNNNMYFDFVSKIRFYGFSADLINFSGKKITTENIKPKSTPMNNASVPIANVVPADVAKPYLSETVSYMVSAEAGKRIFLKKNEKEAIYIQPELQLTYQFTDKYKLYFTNRLKAETDEANSLIGRIGLRIGVDKVQDKKLNFYGKIMYEREFLGNIKTYFNRDKNETNSAMEEIDNAGGWFTYGLGATYLNKEKGTQAYFEVQRSTKHRIQQSWQFNFGFRYTF